MKKYELIIKGLIKKVEKSEELADELIIDVDAWENFTNENLNEISENIKKLDELLPFKMSDDYKYFISNYYCLFLGEFDIFIPYTNVNYEQNCILNNMDCIKNTFENNILLPIGCFSNGDYLFLNEKGEVITFLEIAKDSKPMDELTEVLDDEYEDGWDVAYLKYPDRNGDYRMYWILARSFDEFMNDCVFGDKYLEITDSDDAFYRCVKEIRNDLGI